MEQKKQRTKLLLLFLLDCVVFSLFFAALAFGSLKKLGTGPYALSFLVFSVYSLTRQYTSNRLVPREPRKTTLVETVQGLVVLAGFGLFLLAGSILKERMDVLAANVPFMILIWVFGLLVCFYRFTCDLTKLKSSSVA
jgi:hypothetical protein